MHKLINIGVAGPFSGKRKAYGDLIKKNTENILFTHSQKDYFKINYYDDEADEVRALEISQECVKNKLNAVIGHFNSACAKIVAPIYHKNKVFFIAPASTSTYIPFENKGYVFRTCPTNKDQIKEIIEFFLKQKYWNIRVISEESLYATELMKEFEPFKIWFNFLNEKDSEKLYTQVFLFLGSHVFCAEQFNKLSQKMKEIDVPIIFCDDCYINDFFSRIDKSAIYSKLFVMGFEDGKSYENIFRNSLKSLLNMLLYNSKSLAMDKIKFNLVAYPKIINNI